MCIRLTLGSSWTIAPSSPATIRALARRVSAIGSAIPRAESAPRDGWLSEPRPEEVRASVRWSRPRPPQHRSTRPAAFLVDNAHYIPPRSRVLVPADGEGRNSVFLAEMGHRVVATDIAEEGIAKAQELADARGVSVELRHLDLRRLAPRLHAEAARVPDGRAAAGGTPVHRRAVASGIC